jgi:hypothetical protein
MYKFTKYKTILANTYSLRAIPKTYKSYTASADLTTAFNYYCKGSDVKNVGFGEQDSDEASVVRLKLEQIPELNYGQQYKVVIDRPAIIEDGNNYSNLADDGSYNGSSVMFTIYNINGQFTNLYNSASLYSDAMKVKVAELYANTIINLNNIPHRNRYTSQFLNSYFLNNIIGTKAKTSSLNVSSSNTLYEYSIKPKISSFNVNSSNILNSSAKIYEYSISPVSEFTYISGTSNEPITSYPTISSDIMSNQVTVTITPYRVNGIQVISSNGSGGSFNSSGGVYTISGTYSQVQTYLNTLKVTTTNNFDFHSPLLYKMKDTWTQKEMSSSQLFTPAVDITDNPTFVTSYNSTDGILSFNNFPNIVVGEAGNYTLNMYDNQNAGKVSLMYINQNDDIQYGTTENTVSTAGAFTTVSGDGNRIIQWETGDVGRIYRKTGANTWVSELGITVDNSFLLNRRFDIDFYGYNAIIGNRLYVRSGTSWSLSNTFSVGGYQPIQSQISNDGRTVFITAMNTSNRLCYRYIFKYITNTWTQVGTWGGTGLGSWPQLGTAQQRLQLDLMSKDGNTIFMSTAPLSNIDSGTYSTAIIKVYKFNYSTITYDFFADIESPASFSLFTPYSCSDNGLQLITRYCVNPGSGYYMVPRYYLSSTSSYVYDSSINLNLGSADDSCATISHDGNILICAYNPSSRIRVWKFYSNIWNQLSDITGSSSKYALPSISYDNNFILGNVNKEYYNVPFYNNISFNNSLKQFTLIADASTINNLESRNKLKIMIPHEYRTTDGIDLIYKLTTPSSVNIYKNTVLNKV